MKSIMETFNAHFYWKKKIGNNIAQYLMKLFILKKKEILSKFLIKRKINANFYLKKIMQNNIAQHLINLFL